ncbi:hypothetical protein Tco_0292292, partial [Tanacetum coccineum]
MNLSVKLNPHQQTFHHQLKSLLILLFLKTDGPKKCTLTWLTLSWGYSKIQAAAPGNCIQLGGSSKSWAAAPLVSASYYFRKLSFDDYHGDIQSKLKSHEKLKMDAASMTFDELVAWEKEESLSPLLRTPLLKPRRRGIESLVKNLYAKYLHADYEHVGSDDRSLPSKSKDEFSNEVILDDVVSSLATTLSLLLKKKGKSRVKFTRIRAIIKRSKMLCLRKSLRSNYGRFVIVIRLNEDVGDDDLKDTGCS